MKLNIRTYSGLEKVKANLVDFKPFKMFSSKDTRGYWHVYEFYTGMMLGDGYFKTSKAAESKAIDGYYGLPHWEGRLTERIDYILNSMMKPNLEKYGYANQDNNNPFVLDKE